MYLWVMFVYMVDFSEDELGLAFLRVACVHMWFFTEKSLFLFCSLKVMVLSKLS